MRKLHIKDEWAALGMTSINELKKIKLAYKNMKDRCYNKNNASFKHYGGRGIEVCSKWLSDVDCFIVWSLVNGHKMDITIDRIDNEKGYSPSNCRWASWSVQASNQRRYEIVVIDGESMSVHEACLKAGAKSEKDFNKIWKRIRKYNANTFAELSSHHLRSHRVLSRKNTCLECGTEKSCKWRSDGTVCNTCYCRSYRRNKTDIAGYSQLIVSELEGDIR